ncbi:MAG: phosphoribosyl-ATP diphosphatase [Spirochaetia bacterium]|nr:phosphoribosyl-ATP diphosphatase [Spirochaetia bacterium]
MSDNMSNEKLSRFLFELEELIASRKNGDPEKSYTAKLLQGNINRLLQKVGEESVEYIIEAKSNDKEKTISEAADLLFHFLVSLHGINLNLNDILAELYSRHNKKV